MEQAERSNRLPAATAAAAAGGGRGDLRSSLHRSPYSMVMGQSQRNPQHQQQQQLANNSNQDDHTNANNFYNSYNDLSSYGDDSYSTDGEFDYDDFNNNTNSHDDDYDDTDNLDDSFAVDTSGSNHGYHVRDNTKQEKNRVAALEHQRVFRARVFVSLLLAVTAVCNAVIVYILTKNKEQDDYDQYYNDLSNDVMQVTKENVRVVFVGMNAMSTALTTYVLDDNDDLAVSWPFVTFPNFASLASEVRNVTGAIQIVYVPIVNESERVDWEIYSVYSHGWVREEDPVTFRQRARALQQAVAATGTSNHSSSMEDDTDRRIEQQQEQEQQQSLSRSRFFQPDDWGEELLEAHHSLRYPQQPKQLTPQQPQQRQQQRQSPAALPQQPPIITTRQLHDEEDFRGVIPERIHPAPTREEKLTPGGMKYAPVWQMSPVPYYRGIVNHDLFREPSFQRLTDDVMETRQAVISNQLNDKLVSLLLENHYAPGDSYNNFYHLHPHDTAEIGRNKYPPLSLLVQPVWDNLNLNANMAGYLIALVPWSAYLVDALRYDNEESILAQYDYGESASCIEDPEQLPSSSDDIINTILLNYKVQGGDQVEFLGPGKDFNENDKFYFSMKRTMEFPLEPPPRPPSMLLIENATTAALNDHFDDDDGPIMTPICGMLRMHMYPSVALTNLYITEWPSYYAVMVFFVFSILAVAFFIYNVFVEERRGRVMAVAEKTGRIVSSLFPGQFADQLISEDKKKELEAKKKKKKVVIEEAPNRQLKKFMKDSKSTYQNLNSADGMNGSSHHLDGLGYGDAAPDTEESPLFLAQSKPIADLFPETTVLFADIAGFTAWSSVREPSQVFTLLETVYQNFDYLARQYGIFKIETIGDCYVAVCGLPEPRADHAVAMSRFALACMQKMKVLVSQLEVTLGPDTGDLTMRFGLHSGPVTAGVLRGERARFQLFGDTVNTAARMESTGLRDKIQISQETSDLLVKAGKTHWFVKRDGMVKAKGKGELQTYWLQSAATTKRQSMGFTSAATQRRNSVGGASATRRRSSMGGPLRRNPSQRDPFADANAGSGHLTKSNSDQNISSRFQSSLSDVVSVPPKVNPLLIVGTELSQKQMRLVDWNCELLQQLLRQIVARRNYMKSASRRVTLPFNAMMQELPKLGERMRQANAPTMPLDEVVEVINLPEFDVAAYHGSTDAKNIILDPTVVTQLRRYVSILASRYRDNPFHNFDHASHVAMSVSKLLTRIVVPDLASINDRHDNADISSSLHLTHDMKDLHDHTYGITSDPLTQFAVVLSALIHDVDHRGIPNNILIKEEPEMAAKYKNKSVAEQNSVDIAWEILMQPELKAFLDTICGEYTELRRFRQIIVSSVLATDIFDPELSALRKARWSKAFQKEHEGAAEPSPFGQGPQRRTSFAVGNNNRSNDINRKATIVIEHLIQASDVAHTMQHWHIYQKWNECLFEEMYRAFKEGRSDKDPSEGWYKGEIWFFDNYVIPLAKKLKNCGVFGVSSDEYLDYAEMNRSEWEEKGEGIVAQMLSKFERSIVDKASLGYE